MATLDEALGAKSELAATLAAGVQTLSRTQQITFAQYTRFVLPTDGTVFWLAVTPPVPLVATGSLHYSTTLTQAEDETVGVNQVIFTSIVPVNDLNAVNDQTLYIGSIDEITFAFSSRGRYYQQADLHHYVGTAIYPALQTQIVNNPTSFDRVSQVVSNSLPIWIGLNTYVKPYNDGLVFPVTLYPSFLVPQNVSPPYGVVHVDPGSTRAIASAPFLDRTLGHWQLARETVRVTLYGLRNADVMTFLDFVNQYSYDWNYFGMMNPAIVTDEKRTQPELTTLAIKKTVTFDISYQQEAARNIVRQMIVNAMQTYLPQPLVAGDVAYLT